MATVTKPIALDESLNTTELSSRNVADVLAQELSAVATAIGGISAPSAEDVSYDNSGSGLSATDVQNALDEIVSDIPTVNNGTLTIQQNGTSIGSFSANTASNVTANIKTPTADKKTATDQFTTANGGLLSKCQINLVPVQSGSGDPSPDNVRPISGHTEVDLRTNGKNFLPMTLDGIKALNTIGTWSGNVYSISGGTITLFVDNYNNVIGIQVNGTFNDTVRFRIIIHYTNVFNGYIINGCPEGGASTGKYKLQFYDNTTDNGYDCIGSDITISKANGDDISVLIIIASGFNVLNKMFLPMIRKSTDSATFEPYLGHLYQVQIGSTVYGGTLDLVSGVMTATFGYAEFDGSVDELWGSGTTYSDGSRVFSISGWSSANNAKSGGTVIANYLINAPYSQSNNAITVGSLLNVRMSYADKASFVAFLSGNPLKIAYELATPITIQLTPQQIETLAGQNNLSCPLSGQSIETNGVEYKELFTFADVKSYVDKKIPDAPTTDGTYTLQAVVSGGVPTYSWI